MSSALGQGLAQNKCSVNGCVRPVLTACSPHWNPFQSPSAHASWTLCVRTASSACFTPWFVTGSSSAATALMKMQRLRDAVSGAGGGGNLQSRKTPQGDGPPWGCTSIQVTGLDCVSSLAFYEEGLCLLLQK